MFEMLISLSNFQLFQLFLSHKRPGESRPFAEVESVLNTVERYKRGSFFIVFNLLTDLKKNLGLFYQIHVRCFSVTISVCVQLRLSQR